GHQVNVFQTYQLLCTEIMPQSQQTRTHYNLFMLNQWVVTKFLMNIKPWSVHAYMQDLSPSY
ncbi:hypothetical protein NQ294_29160, partial [Escherichia coli]|nr:hypothetical protein [Escherichia coli]